MSTHCDVVTVVMLEDADGDDGVCVVLSAHYMCLVSPRPTLSTLLSVSAAPLLFTPQPLRTVGILFSPMVSGWVFGRAAGKSLSGLYLRNRKV